MESSTPAENHPVAPARKRSALKRHGIDKYRILKRLSRKENTILYLVGMLVFYVAIALIIPLGCSYYFKEPHHPWTYAILICLIFSIPLLLRFKSAEHTRPTETLFIITSSWLVITFFGSIPFVLSGMGFIDAIFETMSGFTTTGSTIMGGGDVAAIEDWPRSILFWRSMTQWLGGAGIIMIFVTILPMLGATGRSLVTLELAGTDTQNITQRMQEESKKFHYIYASLTLIMFALLIIAGLTPFDAITVSFSSISTGGFSPHSDSVAYFNSTAVEWIIIAFMFLGGTNFFLQFRALKKRNVKEFAKNSEFRAYVLIVILASVMLAAFMAPQLAGLDSLEIVTTSVFQVVSCITTTGYTTTSLAGIGSIAMMLLLLIMVIGASSGSTSGGIKIVRLVILYKFVAATLYKTIHPKAIVPLKINEKSIEERTITSLMALIICYIGTAIFCVFALMLLGIGPMESISATIASISNAGVGLAGLSSSFGGLPVLAKIILVFAMWVGRLEFIAVLVILTPVFWRELLRFRKRYN